MEREEPGINLRLLGGIGDLNGDGESARRRQKSRAGDLRSGTTIGIALR